jgi:hypothetical protein
VRHEKWFSLLQTKQYVAGIVTNATCLPMDIFSLVGSWCGRTNAHLSHLRKCEKQVEGFSIPLSVIVLPPPIIVHMRHMYVRRRVLTTRWCHLPRPPTTSSGSILQCYPTRYPSLVIIEGSPHHVVRDILITDQPTRLTIQHIKDTLLSISWSATALVVTKIHKNFGMDLTQTLHLTSSGLCSL